MGPKVIGGVEITRNLNAMPEPWRMVFMSFLGAENMPMLCPKKIFSWNTTELWIRVFVFADDNPMDNDLRIRSFMDHIGKGYYTCRHCEYGPSIYANVKAHVESKHYSPGYTCSICDQTYRMEKVMKRHMKKCVGPVLPLTIFKNTLS